MRGARRAVRGSRPRRACSGRSDRGLNLARCIGLRVSPQRRQAADPAVALPTPVERDRAGGGKGRRVSPRAKRARRARCSLRLRLALPQPADGVDDFVEVGGLVEDGRPVDRGRPPPHRCLPAARLPPPPSRPDRLPRSRRRVRSARPGPLGPSRDPPECVAVNTYSGDGTISSGSSPKIRNRVSDHNSLVSTASNPSYRPASAPRRPSTAHLERPLPHPRPAGCAPGSRRRRPRRSGSPTPQPAVRCRWAPGDQLPPQSPPRTGQLRPRARVSWRGCG